MVVLPKSCERVAMHWTGLDSMGQTAGLDTHAHITSLFLQGFRCRQYISLHSCYALCRPLMPCYVIVNEQALVSCCVCAAAVFPHPRFLSQGDGAAAEGGAPEPEEVQCGGAPAASKAPAAQPAPGELQPGHRGATIAQQTGRAPIDLLDWLEKAQPQATVQVSDTQLTLGTLSLEQYAKRLSEVAPCSVDMQACTLHRRYGCLRMHSVADMARHMVQFGRRLNVTCPASSADSCLIVRVGFMP